MKELELHPLCTLFPRMAEIEFAALVADIATNGLRQPIVLHEGMILDGGNRYRACIAAEVEPDFIEHDGGNLVSFVLSANMHRRHLSPGQQAAIVASAQDWAKAQTVGNPQFGNLTGLDTVANRRSVSGASDKTQRDADKVAKADPVLAKRVAQGEVSLPQAVEKITGKRPGAKPKPAPVVVVEPDPELIDLRERVVELAKTAKDLLDENTSMGAAFDADDKLAALAKENTQLREMNRVLNERIYGLQGELNEARSAAKLWRSKYDKAARLAA